MNSKQPEGNIKTAGNVESTAFPAIFVFDKIEIMSDKQFIVDPLFPDCPIRNVLARVADKWSILVLHSLQESGAPMRFSALQKSLPDISQKVLTQTLRRLEEDGFLLRNVYAEVPPRVEYQLTERAVSFMQACQPVIEWSVQNLGNITNDRRKAMKKD